MTVGGALGTPGGARGVDHISKIFAVQRHVWIGRRMMRNIQLIQFNDMQAFGYW